VTTGVIILEPWKGPGYTRWNTRFVVDPRGEHEARVIQPVVLEDTVSESREEGEYQSKVLEDKYYPKYWRTNTSQTSVRINLTSNSPFHKGRSPASLCFHWILKTWLPHMVVVVEKGMYGTSLVQLVPLKLMTSRGSLPCGVNSRSHVTPISTPIWYEGFIWLFGGCSVG
jgi:hypothetical protein